MKKTTVGLAVAAASVSAGLAMPAGVAVAAESEAMLEEVVVTGTRRLGRTVADSPAPVDVLNAEDLLRQGTNDMNDLLRATVPSYNVGRLPISDAATVVRPATLRGLPPDSTLVLVNGKRRHRAAVIAELGGSLAAGSQGPDITVIPGLAIDRVEVLRDGAAAQYGSDAIAGVINFQLKENRDGLTFASKVGEFDEGDGDLVEVGVNLGLPLTDAGFISTTLEYSEQDKTVRSSPRNDSRAIIAAGYPDVPITQDWGNPDYDDNWKFFTNAGLQLSENIEAYAFGNYAEKKVRGGFFYREVTDESGTFVANGNRLIFDVADPTGLSSGCPVTPQVSEFNSTPAEFAADQAVIAQVANDPDCFSFTEFFPGGFIPTFGSDNTDWSWVGGVRGDLDVGLPNQLNFDVSYSFGNNETDFLISNTVNNSLGPDSPTEFDLGSYIQREQNVNADFVYPLDTGLFASPLNVAFGAEWRREEFEIVQGQEESWIAGPFTDQGGNPGADGFPGFSPAQVGTFGRENVAFYVDLEADVTERLLIGLAARYEDFSTFGSTDNYKASARYDFIENASGFVNDLALRGTISTGFRAPTPGQSNVTKVSSVTNANGDLVDSGQIPPTNPIAVALGGQALDAETADNISIGVVATLFDRLTITVDYFEIEVSDRISLGGDINIEGQVDQVLGADSPLFDPTNPTQTVGGALQAAGIPGAEAFTQVNFFTNDFDTTTEGLDIVATWNQDWNDWGVTDFSVAFNTTETTVDSFSRDPQDPTEGLVIDRERIVELENFNPEDRWILTANHTLGNWRFMLRASYYDEWVDSGGGRIDTFGTAPACQENLAPSARQDECYGDRWLVDAEVGYTWNDRYTLTIGGENIGDIFPEEEFDRASPFYSGNTYPTGSPFGFNGAFYYGRLQVNL
jgi:iron complex outermembrane receptor protein